jgi:thioredoxin-like negative regulator of GroEL
VPDPHPDFADKVTSDSITVTPGWKLGRFAPFSRVLDPHGTHIIIHKWRLPPYLLLLALLGWLVATAGLHAHIKYRTGFTEVRYSHLVLLPWKIDDHRRARGEFWIRQGLAAAENQEWIEAFSLLRGGIMSVPEHQEARLLVARIYLMARRVDHARDTLLDGLPYHADQLEYLRTVLGFLFSQQADDAVAAVALELRPRLAPSSPAGRMAGTALAYAQFNRGRYAEAEATLREAGLLSTPEGRFVMARIAWDKDRRDEAVARLRELASQVPDDVEIYRTLIFYLRELDRPGEVRRAALARQLARPDAPDGYLDFIASAASEGDFSRATEAETDYLARFAADAPALLRLAETAAKRGDPSAARRVLARCLELDREIPAAHLHVIEAHLESRDYAAALERIAPLVAADGPASAWPEPQQLALAGARAIALYGDGQAMEAAPLVHRLREARRLSPAALTVIAGRLETLGQPAEARALLRHAVELDPLYQPALVNLLERAVASGDLHGMPPLIERLATMRKPPADLIEKLRAALQSDRQLYLADRQKTLAALATAEK